MQNQEWDLQQDILSMMHLVAKSREGLLENRSNPALNLLCQQLSDVLNITGENGPEQYHTTSSEDSSQPSEELSNSDLASVSDEINSSDSSQSESESRSDSPQGSTRSSTCSLPGFSQPTTGGTTRCNHSKCELCKQGLVKKPLHCD